MGGQTVQLIFYGVQSRFGVSVSSFVIGNKVGGVLCESDLVSPVEEKVLCMLNMVSVRGGGGLHPLSEPSPSQ